MGKPAWFKLPLGLGRIGLVAAGILVLVVMVDFNRQLVAGQRLTEDKNLLETQVAQLEGEQSALQTQIAYATTDASVVAWAYGQGKMVQPGEVIVIPMAPPGPTPVPGAVPALPVEVVPNWQLWLGLFLDAESTSMIP